MDNAEVMPRSALAQSKTWKSKSWTGLAVDHLGSLGHKSALERRDKIRQRARLQTHLRRRQPIRGAQMDHGRS
jgi:hypothetical protein